MKSGWEFTCKAVFDSSVADVADKQSALYEFQVDGGSEYAKPINFFNNICE